VSADPFERLLGAGRGSARPDAPEPPEPWWHWPAPAHTRLAEWLEHVASCGYVELVLVASGDPNYATLRAFREDRFAGYAVLDVDGAEEAWLEDHWPRELIVERDEDRVRGRLRCA
jgi:hypothetical protein